MAVASSEELTEVVPQSAELEPTIYVIVGEASILPLSFIYRLKLIHLSTVRDILRWVLQDSAGPLLSRVPLRSRNG